MKVVVGLGNPGKEYESCRHNIGFMTIDKLAEKHGIDISKCELKAMTGKGMIGGEKVLLVKPITYMNKSGECLRQVMDYYKIEPTDFIIIYDDIDLDPGQLRIRERGSAGSHNGMKSVILHMGSQTFPRIRVGAGAKPENWDLADYVLSSIDGTDGREIRKGIDEAVCAAEMILEGNISDAMTKYNAKKDKTDE